MVKSQISEELKKEITEYERYLFNDKTIEELVKESFNTTKQVFEDELEKAIYVILLRNALNQKRGLTSAILAETTGKTKNTINVRTASLVKKHMISQEEVGNAVLFFVPLEIRLIQVICLEYDIRPEKLLPMLLDITTLIPDNHFFQEKQQFIPKILQEKL